VGQFCSELDDVLGELLDLPGIPLICGDFNCPGKGTMLVDSQLTDLIEARGVLQRVDVPTHKGSANTTTQNTLDLIIHLDGMPLLTSTPTTIDVGFSDHLLVLADVFVARPKAEMCTYTYRNHKNFDRDKFVDLILGSDACINPADDVNAYATQMQRAIVNALDSVAPLRTRTKRISKFNSRWLSDAAVEAKRNRRRLEKRWLKSKSEADRVAYRVACRRTNDEINRARGVFCKSRLDECAGDSRQLWRVTKDLLHADRRTQAADEAPGLCNILSSFFVDKVEKIRDIIRSDLLTMPAVSFSFEIQRCYTSISQFTTVTVEEVKGVIAAMPAKSSPLDYISTKLLKEQVDVLAPLVTRLANLSLSSGIFQSFLKTGQVTPLLKKLA